MPIRDTARGRKARWPSRSSCRGSSVPFLTADSRLFDPDRGDNCFIFGGILHFSREKLPIFFLNSTAADNDLDFLYICFHCAFSVGVIDVIGRYFGPITLLSTVKYLFLLAFFRWRYRRYRRYGTFAFGIGVGRVERFWL
jgi:hypothetical protein